MSYRVCAKCDYVINNRLHQEYPCPECGSEDMCCSIENTRDWDKMYKEQTEKLLGKYRPKSLPLKSSFALFLADWKARNDK